MTFDGQMDHGNFAAKPTTVAKKKAAKKQSFFSDSDEDEEEQDSKPQAQPARPQPVVKQQPV